MIRFRTFLSATLSLLAVGTLFAAPTQRDYSPRLKDYLGGKSMSAFGLLDPARMTVSHSVEMGYSSFNGGSLMQSLYATSIGYRISDPLTMAVTLGLSGNRLNMGGAPTTYNSLIGGARLDYRPSKDILVRLQLSHMPGLYRSDWRDDPFGFSTGFTSSSGESDFVR